MIGHRPRVHGEVPSASFSRHSEYHQHLQAVLCATMTLNPVIILMLSFAFSKLDFKLELRCHVTEHAALNPSSTHTKDHIPRATVF